MSFSLFRPLSTLERHNTTKCSAEHSNLIATLTTLGQLDVNSLNDNELINVSAFWSKSMMLAKLYLNFVSLQVNETLFTSILNIAETSILLYKRLSASSTSDVALEPVLTFIGLSDDIFNDADIPSNYPIRSAKPASAHFMLLDFIWRILEEETRPKLKDLFRFSLEIAAKSHQVKESDEVYQYIFSDPDTDPFRGITREQLDDFDNGFLPIISKFESFPILPYLSMTFMYEYLNDASVPALFTIPDFFTRIVEKIIKEEKEFLPLFALTNSDPVHFNGSILPLPFLALIFRRAFIIDESVILNYDKEISMNPLLVYALYANTERPNLIEKFVSLPVHQKEQEFITNAKALLGLSESTEELIRQADNGSENAAKRIYRHNVQLSQLTNEESNLQKILRIMLSDDVKIESPENIDELTHIRLLRLLQLRKPPSQEFIVEILRNLHKKINDLTPKEDFELIMCNTLPPNLKIEKSNIPLPLHFEDFIVYLPFQPFLSFSWLIYVSVLSINSKLFNENEEIIYMFVDFSLHAYLNIANSDHLCDFLFNEMPPLFFTLRKKMKLQHIIKSLEVPEKRIETLKLFVPIFNDSEISFEVSQYLLSLNDEKTFATFFEVSPISASLIASRLDKKVQLSVLEILFRQDSSEMAIEYAKLISSIDKESKDYVLGILWSNAVDHPKCVAQVFSALQSTLDNEDINALLAHLPTFQNEISSGFAQLLRSLLLTLPTHRIRQKNDNTTPLTISTSWSDDIKNKNKQLEENEENNGNEPVLDLWEFPIQYEKCQKEVTSKQAMFWCYTCGISGDEYICEQCAEHCHLGHDIAFASLLEHQVCSCGSHCKEPGSIDESNNNQAKLQKTDVKRPTVSDTTLVNLFVNLATSKIAETSKTSSPTSISGNVSGSLLGQPILEELNLNSPSKIVPCPTKFKTIQDSPKFFSAVDLVNIFSSRETTTHLIRRCSVVPFHMMEMAGPDSEILVVCYGQRLTSYNKSTLKQLHQFQIDIIGFQLTVCSLDPSVFAVASLHGVTILSVDSEGKFHQTSKIELMLEELGSHIFVNSIHWVPMQVMHLAVVCNVFIKIYDVPSDCLSPVACFMPPNDSFFTSAVFTTFNDISYGIFALNKGQIALQETDVDATAGPITISSFINVRGSRVPQQPVISICESSGLMFISAMNYDMLIMKLSEVIERNLECHQISLGDFKNAFSFTARDGTAHYFEHTTSGGILLIDITENSINVSSMNRNLPSCQLPLFEGNSNYLSTLIIDREFRAISPSNGKLMALVSSREVSDDSDDTEDAESNNEAEDTENCPPNINVPARFWSLSHISTNDISVLEPRSSKDCRDLLSGSRYIFDNRLTHKVLNIQSTNPDQLVVGFRIFLGASAPYHRPPWVKVNGRKTEVSCLRSFMLPLKAKEVKPKVVNKIELGSNNGYDINCDRLDVFVINRAQFPPKYAALFQKSFDWLAFGSSIFDFVDKKEDYTPGKSNSDFYQSDKLLPLMKLCSLAVVGGREEIPEDLMRKVIRLMYERYDVSELCRRILVKCANNQDATIKIWADEIVKTVQEKKVAKESWELLWRDISLLPKSVMEETSSMIWEAEPVIEGPFTVFSAFLTK